MLLILNKSNPQFSGYKVSLTSRRFKEMNGQIILILQVELLSPPLTTNVKFNYLQIMKNTLFPFLLAALLAACNGKHDSLHLNGTWRLLSGTTITKGIADVTDYTKDQSMIKIINNTHFAFLKHRLNAAKDSSNQFDAGGGSYTLQGNQYTERLDYYNDRNWEGKTFTFTVSVDNDTLIQKGIEKVEGAGIDREIIEKYLRIKD
jgi:hypothetical protein